MTKQIVGVTAWFSILFIAFGRMTGYLQSNPIVWFFFIFFCAIGVLVFAFSVQKK